MKTQLNKAGIEIGFAYYPFEKSPTKQECAKNLFES